MACEPLTGECFGPEVARKMKLPFTYGWDHWAVFQGDKKIAVFEDYSLAVRTAAALNATLILQEAA